MKNNNIIFIVYYIYAILLIIGTAYLVFYKDISGWYFLLTIVFLQIKPSVKNKKE